MNKSIIILLILLIIGACLLGGLFTKISSNSSVNITCTVGEEPTEDKRLTMPDILNPDKAFDGSQEDYGIDRSKTAEYKLIRLNVPMLNERIREEGIFIDPIFDRRDHTEKYDESTIPGFVVYYPGKFGEVTLEKPFVSKYEGLTTEFRFRQEGIIFLVHTDSSGKPVVLPAKDRKGTERQFWVVDLYQQVAKAEDTTRGYILSQIFACSDTSTVGQKIISPTMRTGDKGQLQIGTFKITSDSKGFDAHCKPAIYLYPKKAMSVSVKVHTKGELIYTDPIYPAGGWKVFAYPDGRVLSFGKTYPYLYYESRVPDTLVQKPNEGYVIAYNQLSEKFSSLLPQLGLSEKQTSDFSAYWMKVLPKAPYYFVGIFSQANLDTFEPLEITPKEDTLIRVRLYFQALTEKTSVPEPTILTPRWNGFTVVEWGGMIKLKSGEAFTCLQ